jgi:electron transport complex protein RnfB
MVLACLILGLLGFILALGLGVAFQKLKVEVDPRQEELLNALPGANCGGCGFPGCSGFAEALVQQKAEPTGCPAGGQEVREKIAHILGIEVEAGEEKKAVVKCRGGFPEAKEKFIYDGIDDCQAASLAAGGRKACLYGCLGFGTCLRACPFNAISRGQNHLPIIDRNKCTGCGKCVQECPKKLISLEPISRQLFLFCSSLDKGAVARKLCKFACLGCGLCLKQCEQKAIRLEKNLAIIDFEKCTLCGKCAQKCPTKCLVMNTNYG